jgi:type III restriction enzyme
MEPKDYQQKSLRVIRDYLCHLEEFKRINDKVVAEHGDDAAIDFPAKAWGKTDILRGYSSRKDGVGRALPCFCLKIPTGGGKTYLAVKTIDLINGCYLKKQTGLVLWVVPTTQIFDQTIRSLRDREHPYRQHLDIASGGRTQIIEKMERFTPLDVTENLVVLMLMLPSASRKIKDVLRMFKDSGGYQEFFPSEDDAEGQKHLLEKIPNLDTFDTDHAFWGRQVKTSLGNTLRKLNPILILDEGHKAYSDTAQDTLRGFNPSIIVELSATPPAGSNNLVDITGIELNREEMVKFDLHIKNKADCNWKETLLESHHFLDHLKQKANELEASTGQYIRPINLIQVERTGKDQRDGKHIHAEDVREHLIKILGVLPEEVAVKTSEKNELKELDDIGGLMSKNCKIRYIITKQALQEGWDCAFAYILTVLTNPGSKTAMTQLVGRILRQPNARKTKVKELDESYVFCFQQRGKAILDEIRDGFRGEGLGDLAGRIALDEGDDGDKGSQEVECRIREKFQKAAEHAILPVFVIHEKGDHRAVNYMMDIEARVPWDKANLEPLYKLELSFIKQQDSEAILSISSDRHRVVEQKDVVELQRGVLAIDYVFLSKQLIDIVSNPWLSYEFGKEVFGQLLKRYEKDLVLNNFVFVVEEMRKHLQKEKDRLAEEVFSQLIKKDVLRFMVITNQLGFSLFKKSKIVQTSKRLTKKNGQPLERSLFDPVPEEDFNELEKPVAWYLEDQDKLLFWYRNISKKDYAVQGWRKNKIYADFIFTDIEKAPKYFNRVFVVETKGVHLIDNSDTEYKKKVFDLCNQVAKETTRSQLGLKFDSANLEFHIISGEDWQNRLNSLFN